MRLESFKSFVEDKYNKNALRKLNSVNSKHNIDEKESFIREKNKKKNKRQVQRLQIQESRNKSFLYSFPWQSAWHIQSPHCQNWISLVTALLPFSIYQMFENSAHFFEVKFSQKIKMTCPAFTNNLDTRPDKLSPHVCAKVSFINKDTGSLYNLNWGLFAP